ncbi:MAG TPA: response regulator [Candidatus Omnitrophota bacterium]|nr:response regulator [Candidatus Omnitrophota bacterium]
MSQKILVVDDDVSTIKLVETVLKSKGYGTFSAVDGLDALVKIKTQDPDLVVLDIMMPEINGYDVCYQLRFNDDFKKLPIVLLTKREQELDEKISQKVNIEYVPKPVDSKLLLEKIEKLLTKK